MSHGQPDIAPEQVDEKWRAYPDTVLEFDADPSLRIDLREPVTDGARTRLAALGLSAAFGVFTAENPVGENAEEESSPTAEERERRANWSRESRLERELHERGVDHVRVDGVSPGGQYREHCVAALMARDDAVALARRYEQLALFWYDGATFWLLPALAAKSARRLP